MKKRSKFILISAVAVILALVAYRAGCDYFNRKMAARILSEIGRQEEPAGETDDSQAAPQGAPGETPAKPSQPGASAGNQDASPRPAPSYLSEIEKKIDKKDVERVKNMIYSKLSAAQISELSAMFAGGVTKEERVRAKEILKSALPAADIAVLKELYNKYADKF